MSVRSPRFWAVIPAAGGGARMGGRKPKQYLDLCGRTLLEWSIRPFLEAGWIDGVVDRIIPSDPALKIPHMGWNDLQIDVHHPVLEGVSTGEHAYFVHSYAMRVDTPLQRLAHVDYGGDVTAIVGRDNLVGMQFHPEKSQSAGLRMIANFLGWRP